jgi:hypothetical protein
MRKYCPSRPVTARKSRWSVVSRGNVEGPAGSLYGFEKQAVVVLVAVKH